MKLADIPFTTLDWQALPAEVHPGEAGQAAWRTFSAGNVRARIVEYSPGYLADHWCERGHVLFVLEGELVTELADGSAHVMGPGQGYCVAGDASSHRSRTATGARLFIVD
ncbi:MAG: DHCW motif cupin fold protein [Acidobacteriota bacterium]